jgi:hypothetical protein
MKNIIVTFLVLTLAGGGFVVYKNSKEYKEPVPAAVVFSDVQRYANPDDAIGGSVQTEAGGSEEISDEPVKLPEDLNLKMTFYSQAPNGNWDYPWQEACEEASVLLIANEYYGHEWTRDEFNDEILKIVDWEKGYFGSYEHTDMSQTAEMLKKYLGLNSVIHENPTYEDIEKVLSSGHLIVMPFAGKELNNPYFTNGGPNYHVMVVKGYKSAEKKIITDDVGTRRGEDFVYTWDNIHSSLHDYAEPITQGSKRMIEVLPPDKTAGF